MRKRRVVIVLVTMAAMVAAFCLVLRSDYFQRHFGLGAFRYSVTVGLMEADGVKPVSVEDYTVRMYSGEPLTKRGSTYVAALDHGMYGLVVEYQGHSVMLTQENDNNWNQTMWLLKLMPDDSGVMMTSWDVYGGDGKVQAFVPWDVYSGGCGRRTTVRPYGAAKVLSVKYDIV